MEIVAIKDFKRDIRSFFQKVVSNAESIIVKDDLNGDVVIMSRAEYYSWQETFYLLKSPSNAKRLLDGIEEYEQSRIKS